MSAESEAKKLSVLVVMGVSGAGKSTIAALLALRLRWTYEDADWFHPPSNIEKMHCGGRGSIGSRCAIRRPRGGGGLWPGGPFQTIGPARAFGVSCVVGTPFWGPVYLFVCD